MHVCESSAACIWTRMYMDTYIVYGHIHACMHTFSTRNSYIYDCVQHGIHFYYIRCLDEPPACILHQMLAPSHRASSGVNLKHTHS